MNVSKMCEAMKAGRIWLVIVRGEVFLVENPDILAGGQPVIVANLNQAFANYLHIAESLGIDTTKDTITSQQIAKLMSIPYTTLRRAVHDGTLKPIQRKRSGTTEGWHWSQTDGRFAYLIGSLTRQNLTLRFASSVAQTLAKGEFLDQAGTLRAESQEVAHAS